jgi:hypothetical protein
MDKFITIENLPNLAHKIATVEFCSCITPVTGTGEHISAGTYGRNMAVMP